MSVVAQKNAAGDVALGVEIEGVFIPCAVVPEQRVKHLVERGHGLAERAKDAAHEGHAEAKKAREADFQPLKPSSGAKGQS